MPTIATRLITLIMLLQRKPNQKAAELAAELGVSVRTLHRYFAMLDEMGIPIYTERGPTGGFSLVRGYRLPPLVFTPEEAVAVHLGVSLVEEIWGRMYREAARGALATLENVLPDEQRGEVVWARRTLLATGMQRSNPEELAQTLETLRKAARENRQARFAYRGSGRPASERTIDPYGLAHRWGWWYVVGYCHSREEMRTFRLDRIAGLELLDRHFERPEDFDLHSYLAKQPPTTALFRARLRFQPAGAQVALENRVNWETLDEQADSSVIVTLAAPNIEWAASTALAYGPIVEVLEPPELRRIVREWAQAVVAQYSNGDD
jgi:predicted DNA-binding transcriptional regulator YafY